MPTKCLKVDNLFDIVKCIIIGLEEKIGFQELSIITDDNAINKKISLSFAVCQSFPLYIVMSLLSCPDDILNIVIFLVPDMLAKKYVNEKNL